jgi:RND family efflux transporter MFP subunit
MQGATLAFELAVWIGLMLLLGLSSGCGPKDDAQRRQGSGAGNAARAEASGNSERGSQTTRATAVEVAAVEVGSIARLLTVSGVVEPIRTIAVNSQLSGALVSVIVEEGDVVQKGDPLAQLDDREIQAQLAAAEAAYQVAESAYERSTRLRQRNVITLPEYERDRTAYAAAKAQLDQLRTRLEYATIVAPIAGVVTEKRVEAGDIVAPQTRLFRVADISTMVVRVQVSELDVVDLQTDDAVEVALDAFPDRQFEGRIRRIFPAADPMTRLVPVEVAFEGEVARLARPGFLARTTFALGMHENVLLVPASALVRGADTEAVFLVQDDTATRRTVSTGLISQGRVEITDGLRIGDLVVTVGNNALQDGAAIRVVDRTEAKR